MVMESSLSPVCEISQAEEHAASLADVYDQIGDLGGKIRSSDARLSTLDSKIGSLDDKMGSQDLKFGAIERKLELLLNSMPGIATVQEVGGTSQTLPPRSQDHRNQVRVSQLEPCRGVIRPRIRENLLKNVEMPMFDGSGIYGWIARVERFFRSGGYNEAEQLALVSVSVSGEALSWYNWAISRGDFVSWLKLKSGLMLRFGNLKLRGPSQSLFCIKQTGSVAEYVQRFEDLSSQVGGLDDQKLEGIFLNGLTGEMQELVHMHKPQNLPEMVAVARSMETSVMRRVVQKELQLVSKENKDPHWSEYKSSYTPATNNWKMKSVMTESNHGSDKPIGRNDQRLDGIQCRIG